MTRQLARAVPRAGTLATERLTVAEALRAVRVAPAYEGMEGIRRAVSRRRIDRCLAEDDDKLSTSEAGWLLCRSRQYVVGLIRAGELRATREPFRDSWRWLVRFADIARTE